MIKSDDSGIGRRRFPRVKAPVYYRPASISEIKRQAANISLGGMQIYSNKPVKEGKLLEIELFLPNRHLIEATARIVWIKALPPGSEALYIIGLEFIHMSTKSKKELKSVLDKASSNT